MKKYLKMTRNIVFFGGLYYVMTMISGMLYAVGYMIANKAENAESMQKSLMSNIYLVTTIAAVITLGIFFLVLRNKEQNLLQRCNFKKISGCDIGKIILMAISITMFSCSVVYLTASKFESYDKVSESLSSAHGSILAMVSVVILIPMFEEILFRGLIFNELRKNINIYVAIIIQAIIFAVFHGNLLQGIYTFILGVILSLLYMWTKSLWANILCHIVYNLFGTIIVPVLLYFTHSFVYGYMAIGLIGTSIVLINMFKKHKKSVTLQETEWQAKF